MIPMLILYLIRKFKNLPEKKNKLKRISQLAIKAGAVLIIILTTSSFSKTPKKSITYNVVKNHETIGSIKIIRDVLGDSTIYSLKSNIKAKYILKFNISGNEKAVYKDNFLVYSSVFRKVNNKVKVNHSITLKNQRYHLNTDDKIKSLELPLIKQNLVTLYFKEPIGINKIYCDNLKCMLNVKSLGHGKYKVEFSKGKYNVFHYKNGVCVKIEAVSPMFNVSLLPA